LFTQGRLAVTFFFVLSGFLITYLLLREHETTGQVAVGRFYFRRVLRIWPLYYLLVLIGLVLIPAGIKLGRVKYAAPYEAHEVVAYFLVFLPFVVNLKYGNHFLTPLWSIGVEEMYYFGWAPIVKFFRRHLLTILVGTVVAKAAFAAWAEYYLQSALMAEVLRMLQFEAMAIGGLAAYVVFHRERPIGTNAFFSKPVQAMLITVLMVRIFANEALAAGWAPYASVFAHPVISPLVMMVLFAWLIVNVAVNERSILQLNSRVLNYLGDISYGIYMYHGLAISILLVPKVKKLRAAPFVTSTLLLHVGIFALTLVLAALSKAYFENRFLRYKDRFMPTGSGSRCEDTEESAPPARAA
jgi:peptidoglycan/LPS O-acetylase OafA/YrhL